MSFFGFDTSLDRDLHRVSQDEDLAVYTYGEEGYDNLADALDEGLDDLNDETFGDTGAISNEFDFAANTLPEDEHFQKRPQPQDRSSQPPAPEDATSNGHHATTASYQSHGSQPSLEAIWADRLPIGDSQEPLADRRHLGESFPNELPAPPSSAKFSPFASFETSSGLAQHPSRARTLAEIEAEQRAAAQLSRMSLSSPQSSPQPSSSYAKRHVPELSREFRQSPLMQSAVPNNGNNMEKELLLRSQRQFQEQQQQQQQQELLLAQRQQLLQQERLQQHAEYEQQRFLEQQQQQQQQREQLLRQQQLQQQQQQQQQQQLLQQQLLAAQTGLPRRLGTPLSQGHQHPLIEQINMMEASGHILSVEQREALMNEAMSKIMEAERMEEKRRRRLAKIARMSKYNDLMTQSDKDFITRIQVSQLVTQDPYAEDFYAQVFGAIHRSRMGYVGQDPSVVNFGNIGGVGVGLPPGHRGAGRRENALNRMQAQVERIVSNSKNREKIPQSNLQGALGKVSGRSYKAAPRQLLQVDLNSTPSSSSLEAREGAAKEAAKQGRDALADAAGSELVRQQPLTRRQVLVALEGLYDAVLRVEQLRREQPSQENPEAFTRWNEKYTALVDQLWSDSKIMAPLETSDPHPFVSLLIPIKGKRLLPRLLRHVDQKRLNLFFTLLVACYSQLDVVQNAGALDQIETTPEKQEAEVQNDVFFATVIPTSMSLVRAAPLRFVTGMLGLLLESGSVIVVSQSRAGLGLLTILLSRVATLKQVPPTDPEAPAPEDLDQWQIMFDHLCQFLFGDLLSLFPSTRMAASLPPGPNYYLRASKSVDLADQSVWHFLAALALCASNEQQQHLVTELREKVLENVVSATKGWVSDESERIAKLDNVNLFLHALGLDSSQIAV